jgi:hypothetical protein
MGGTQHVSDDLVHLQLSPIITQRTSIIRQTGSTTSIRDNFHPVAWGVINCKSNSYCSVHQLPASSLAPHHRAKPGAASPLFIGTIYSVLGPESALQRKF